MAQSFRNDQEWYDEIPEFIPDDPKVDLKQLKGLYIDGKYLYNPDLSVTEMHLMAYINFLDQKDHCYASNKYLAGLMGCSEKRISNMLIDLRKKGLI